jgi:hypothetical protein
MTIPQKDEDGWIRWDGGECPIGDDVAHEVRFRDGSLFCEADAVASKWDWRHTDVKGDIVAYRVFA